MVAGHGCWDGEWRRMGAEKEKEVSEITGALAPIKFQKLVSCVWRKGHFSQENLFLFLKFIFA
jgi:hypothetical protein